MNNINSFKTSVTAILAHNNIDELSLGNINELNDPTYVIWYDNHGTPYEDPVIKVLRQEEGLSFEIDARDFGNTITIQDYDIDREEWWEGIRDNMLEVLQRDAIRRCLTCGKPLKTHQQFCSDACCKLIPPTLQEVVLLANSRIRQLIGQIAGTDRKLEKKLIQKYSIKV